MGMPGGFEKIRRDADTSARHMVTALTRRRRAENIAAAETIHQIADLADLRLCTEAAIHDHGLQHGRSDDRVQPGVDEPDVYRARLSVESETAAALSVSRTVARDMITTGEELTNRLHAVDAAFTAGDLDYPRVRVIATILARASTKTVEALEDDILAAAARCTPASLQKNIWRQWTAYNPSEAADARKAAEAEQRGVSIRHNIDGTASLFASLTTLEAAHCDGILDELAATVCRNDPRTRKQRRADALIALINHEDSLRCLCRNEECPVAHSTDHLGPRRQPLVQVLVDIETLLGLTDTPATLADGTTLDPDTARILATDARWQGFLTEMRTAAIEYLDNNETNGNESESVTAQSASPEITASESTTWGTASSAEDKGTEDRGDTDDSGGQSGPGPTPGDPPPDGPDGPDGIESATTESGSTRVQSVCNHHLPTPRSRRILTRGRTRPAPPLPPPLPPDRRRTPTRTGTERAVRDAVTSYLAAAKKDPALTTGPHPDGHGGHPTPPPGALTYRPTTALVALVRATHTTCTFPYCTVPAARCDIDHIVPFDHANPYAGGWTILANLHPLCSYHHHAKTLELWHCAKLTGDAVYWRSATGQHHITPAEHGTIPTLVPDTFTHSRPRAQPTGPSLAAFTGVYVVDADTEPVADLLPPPPDELYEATWWETHITDTPHYRDTYAPTLEDIARITDPLARADATELRNHYLHHKNVVAARERYRPPPF